MSRRRIVVGEDERGRPKAEWEDAPEDAPRYGHMEPAFTAPIERRQLTEAERAARPAATPTQRAWNGMDPSRAGRPAKGSPEHLAQSRQNGARRHVEVMAARRPKEEPMPLPELPDHVAGDDPYETLIAAAEVARQATLEEYGARDALWAAVEAARLAKEALAAAWKIVATTDDLVAVTVSTAPSGAAFAGLVTGALMSEARASVALDEHPDAMRTVEPSATPRQPGRKAQEAQEKAERASRVMAAMVRHDGDQRAVAAELGMRANAVAMVVKHARARAEVGA